jgi:hypothetical protein
MDTTRLRVGPPCTRDQRPAASLDTVRHEQRSSEKRGHIYRTGSFTKGTHEAHRFPCCSARYCHPPSKPQRTRDAHYWAPPAQIRTCGLPAYGSYLGCLTAKRTFGQGCRIRGLGSHSSASWATRSHVVRSFWLRRRSVRPHKTLTWCRKAASARLLVGTAW